MYWRPSKWEQVGFAPHPISWEAQDGLHDMLPCSVTSWQVSQQSLTRVKDLNETYAMWQNKNKKHTNNQKPNTWLKTIDLATFQTTSPLFYGLSILYLKWDLLLYFPSSTSLAKNIRSEQGVGQCHIQELQPRIFPIQNT